MDEIRRLQILAREIRKDVLRMTYEKKAGFIGTSFSCADILAVLYFLPLQAAPHDSP